MAIALLEQVGEHYESHRHSLNRWPLQLVISNERIASIGLRAARCRQWFLANNVETR